MMLDLFGLAAIITKFALYLGVLTATGTVLATRLFRLDRTNGLAAAFASLGLLATIFAFLLRGANLTGDASGMIDPEMLSLLWATPVGTAFMARVLSLSLLIFGLFLGRIGIWISVLGGVIAVGSLGQVGHIADRGVLLLDMTLMIHLLAIALWIGILTPLRRLASSVSSFADAATVGHQFGIIASVTVPGLIVAGVYMSYQLVGSLEALTETEYGQALIIKVLLVGLLPAFAAANKLRFVPALRSGDPLGASHLSKSILAEWLIIIAVLGTTAVLTTNLTLPT
jgi:putative copper resistance protein D